MRKENLIYINNGVSQEERLSPMLSPNSIKIDDRTLLQLVSFLGEYASLINYYSYNKTTGDLEKDGDWSFFINDPIFRLAEIATTDASKFAEEINLIQTTFQKEGVSVSEMVYALRLLFNVISSMLLSINQWLKYIEVLPEDFTEKLTKIIQNKLSISLTGAIEWADFFGQKANQSNYVYFEKELIYRFDKRYWLDFSKEFKPLVSIEKLNEKRDDRAVLLNNYKAVVNIAQEIINQYNKIASIAKSTFYKFIEDKSDIKPDLGLLLTFLNLFEKAQDKINGISTKHLNYYYRDVLNFKENKAIPDKTFLVITPVPGSSDISLKKGLLFNGGKDKNGTTVTYSALQDTVVNQVQIASLKNVFIAANSIAQPLNLTTGNPLITGIFSVDHPYPILSPGQFPLFGEDQFMYSEEQQTMNPVHLGFSVSSPSFFVSEGQRTISLKLHFTETSFTENFINNINNLSAQTENGSYTFDEIFNKIFFNAIQVSATGLKNWFTLTVSNISYSINPVPSITITLFLDPTVEEVVAYNAKVHGSSYTTPYPVLEFRLMNNFPYYSYNFLNNLELTKIAITCTVKELKKISLYNQYGQIDSSKPFQPFGLQPEKGYYLLIGSNEVFIKNVSEIELMINWQSLPITGNFATYYDGYPSEDPFTNNAFVVMSSFLNKGTWLVPTKFAPAFPLFNEATPSAINDTKSYGINSQSTFQFTPLDNLISPENIDPGTIAVPLKYNSNTLFAFMKLEICAPAYGFGAGLYNNALSGVLLENARNQMNPALKNTIDLDETKSSEDTKPKALPNIPFTPIASSIYINYTASDEIDLSPGNNYKNGYEPFYYIDTFETYSASQANHFKVKALQKSTPVNDDKKIAGYKLLLPQYSIQGNLCIGLKNVSAPQSLTLLFELSEKPVEASISVLPKVTWSYLSKNQWKNFVPDLTMHDGTNGLIKSGIVTLIIPGDISNENVMMPNELFWIRIQACEQLNIFGNLISIYPQALQVECSNTDYTQRDDLRLPALSITKAMETIPKVKSIMQPFASSEGVFYESEKLFYTRVSERLRHKKRVIVPWDYERLVLQYFPQVYKAKILPASTQNSKKDSFTPGSINLVVIPKINLTELNVIDDSCHEPTFGFTVLEEIKEFIQRYTSAHAKITVRNPVYEKLMIKCNIKFHDNNPFFLKQLNNDLNNFLTPWIKGNETANIIGNGIQRSTILAFIQELSYVQFVTGFSLIKTSKINGVYNFYDSAVIKNPNEDNNDMLYALTPYTVFVPVKNHFITIIDEEIYTDPQPLGIDTLTIEDHFIIGSDKDIPANNATNLTLPTNYLPKKNDSSQENTFYVI